MCVNFKLLKQINKPLWGLYLSASFFLKAKEKRRTIIFGGKSIKYGQKRLLCPNDYKWLERQSLFFGGGMCDLLSLYEFGFLINKDNFFNDFVIFITIVV